MTLLLSRKEFSMKLKYTIRFGMAALVILSGNLLVAPSAQAQFGGGGPPPGMMEKIKKWQKWGEQHKNLSTLGDLVYQINEINKDARFALTKPQANKVLALIKPVTPKKELSEDEAKSLSKSLTNVLTTKQLQKLATIEGPAAKMRKRGFGGGGGRPAGGPPKGGPPTIPEPPKGGYNPLNPDTMPFAQARPAMKAMMNSFVSGLQHAK